MTMIEAFIHDGICCPACGVADEINGDSVGVKGNQAIQPQTCLKCGAAWVAIFKLSAVEDIEKADLSRD